jgi:hypothetical protein
MMKMAVHVICAFLWWGGRGQIRQQQRLQRFSRDTQRAGKMARRGQMDDKPGKLISQEGWRGMLPA